MFYKLYPREQIKNYLLIDIVMIVFLSYRVLRSDTALGIWGSLLLLLLFLVSFYVALWRPRGMLLAAVLSGLVSLILLSVFTGPGTMLFGIIFADLLGRSRSVWQIAAGSAVIPLSFILVFVIRQEHLLEASNTIYLPLIIIQTVYPFIIYIKEKAKSLQGELNEANEQIAMYIKQEERHRIARDLHDTLGQTLMMIKMKSELAHKWVDKDTTQAKRELNEILDTSRAALKQVRELVSEMNFISLTAELEHSAKLLNTAGVALITKNQGKSPVLSSVEETMLALCIREAMTNIIKHSQAKQCTIQMEMKEGAYEIHIVDDGIGLTNQGGGNGIPSIMERMKRIGGSCVISSTSDEGTTIILKLPLCRNEKEDIS
ncbi:sensor histidine kinase [Neobacillus mesonae]|nr:sensor histidine kinase [Neobacillus mesonae]